MKAFTRWIRRLDARRVKPAGRARPLRGVDGEARWFARSRLLALATAGALLTIVAIASLTGAGAALGLDTGRLSRLAGTFGPLAVVIILFLHSRTQERLDVRAGRPSARASGTGG